MPASTPNTSTPTKAASERNASTRSIRTSRTNPRTSMRRAAAAITTAARVADGRNAVSPGTRSMNAAISTAPTTPVSWVRAPACSATGVRDDDAGDREPAEEPLRDVRGADGRHLATAAHRLAPARRERAGEHGGVGEGDERDAGRGQRERRDIRPLEPAEGGGGEPLRQCADHGQPVGRPRMAVSAVAATTATSTPGTGDLPSVSPMMTARDADAERHGERLDLARGEPGADGDHVAEQRARVDRESEQLRHLRDEHEQGDGIEVARRGWASRSGRSRIRVAGCRRAARIAPTMIASSPASATARVVVSECERQDRRRDDRSERGVGPEHQDAGRPERAHTPAAGRWWRRGPVSGGSPATSA